MTLETKTNWRKIFKWTSLIFFLLALCSSTTANSSDEWQQLTDGIEYKDLGGKLLKPWGHIHVFRIDLKKNKLGLITADALSKHSASVNEYGQYANALLAINGGFFDRNYQSLGLRVSNFQQKKPIKRISWWGVFYIKDNIPGISSMAAFSKSKGINFAIQSGPRLLVNKKIPPLKAGKAERSVLGITKNKSLIVLVTDNAPMSTTELAMLLKSAPLSCTDALNLDGGNSSQLYSNINSFKLSVHGFSNVSDAIIVKKK